MSKKRKKTIISEIKQIDRRKTQPGKNKSYLKFVRFWELQKSILNKLIKEYPQTKEQWMTDVDEFVEVWNSYVDSEIKLTSDQPTLNSLDDEESMISYLPIFIKAKQSLDNFLDTKNYSLEEKSILKNSYIVIYLLALEDLFMKKQKSFNSTNLSFKEENSIQRNISEEANLSDFLMWLMSYYVLHEDFIFELPQLEWFLEEASDLA